MSVEPDILAAYNALQPIRELHQRGYWCPCGCGLSLSESRGAYDHEVCVECKRKWPCDTARLIYPKGEL